MPKQLDAALYLGRLFKATQSTLVPALALYLGALTALYPGNVLPCIWPQ